MASSISMASIGRTEQAMKVRFPASFKLYMARHNGGEVDLDGESWFLFPFFDETSRTTIRKTANDIRRETESALDSGIGFPSNGIAIANNGGGDLLVLRHEDGVVGSEVWIFRLRVGELAVARDDVAALSEADY